MENTQKNENLNINDTETLAKNLKTAEEFVKNLLKTMNIDAKIKTEEKPNTVVLQIEVEDGSFLIGPRGETMQAIQTLTNAQLMHGSRLGKRILIDINGYRDAQEQKLKEDIKQAIEKCLQTAKPITLDFMNAYERHLVHEIVLEDGRVVSESFGQEPRRFVKIFIK